MATLAFQLGRAEYERGEEAEARALMEAALATRVELLGAEAPATQQLRDALARYFP